MFVFPPYVARYGQAAITLATPSKRYSQPRQHCWPRKRAKVFWRKYLNRCAWFVLAVCPEPIAHSSLCLLCPLHFVPVSRVAPLLKRCLKTAIQPRAFNYKTYPVSVHNPSAPPWLLDHDLTPPHDSRCPPFALRLLLQTMQRKDHATTPIPHKHKATSPRL